MDIPIIHEDDHIVVINKPPGIVVNNAESVKGETVQDWAHTYLGITRPEVVFKPVIHPDGTVERNIPLEFAGRAGIVHRIDKETSGCLVIAKTPVVFEELQRQFKEREIHKTYLAIVHGAVVPEVGEVRAPVGRLPWNKEHFGIVPGGKDSVTRYKVERSWETVHGKNHETVSLVALFPETGRTHQIRVHMKYINHPLVGDYLYAGRKTARNDRLWAPRVMLHAWKIEFSYPPSHLLALEAPIPDDMKSIIG
jgi:23S rRNA pseudouridine1911/1915/1917 synthase